MGREVFLESASGVELNGHHPGVGIPAASSETYAAVVVAEVVHRNTPECPDICCGVAPEKEVAAVSIPFLYIGSRVVYDFGHFEHLVFRTVFEIAHPEENAVGLKGIGRCDIAEIDVGSSRIFSLKPEPCASLIVIAVLYQVFLCRICAEEADSCLTDPE